MAAMGPRKEAVDKRAEERLNNNGGVIAIWELQGTCEEGVLGYSKEASNAATCKPEVADAHAGADATKTQAVSCNSYQPSLIAGLVADRWRTERAQFNGGGLGRDAGGRRGDGALRGDTHDSRRCHSSQANCKHDAEQGCQHCFE